MESEKKESNGLPIFLVILSSLGMLAVIVILAFVFFYPGDISDLISSEGPQTSSFNQRVPELDVEPLLSAENPESKLPEETSNKPEEETSMEVPEADLDNSDAIINSLMENDNQAEDDKGDSPLDIRFDERDEPDRNIDKPAAEAPEIQEPVVEPEQVPQPRYRDVSRDVYYIQVGSFPNSIKADELQSVLNQKGIHSAVQTRDINGTLYYRVRIGAFSSKLEAEQFDLTLKSLPQIDETIIYTSTVTERQRIE